jgi:hypothetical protein
VMVGNDVKSDTLAWECVDRLLERGEVDAAADMCTAVRAYAERPGKEEVWSWSMQSLADEVGLAKGDASATAKRLSTDELMPTDAVARGLALSGDLPVPRLSIELPLMQTEPVAHRRRMRRVRVRGTDGADAQPWRLPEWTAPSAPGADGSTPEDPDVGPSGAVGRQPKPPTGPQFDL